MDSWCYFVITLGFFACFGVSKASSCTTPNGEQAVCKSIFSCPVLQAAFASQDAAVKKFLKASSCGTEQFMICCGTSANYTYIPALRNRFKQNETVSYKDFALNWLPSRKYCGMQHSDDYFYNASATSVDEFPWMVYILAANRDKHSTGHVVCTGVLISNRHVLTISPCALHYFTSVKLGQYDKNKNVSCVQTRFGEDDCTEPTIEVAVDKIPLDDDFLMLRLAHNITYSDYIRPICLPLENLDLPRIGDEVATSGWGRRNYESSYSAIKKRIEHTVVGRTEKRIYTTVSSSADTACDGDDGGPLMYKSELNWFAAGVVFFYDCDNNNKTVDSLRITQKVLDSIFKYMYLSKE